MSIRLKLIIAFNIFLAALAILGYFTYSQLDRSKELSGGVSSQAIDRIEHTAHLSQELSRIRSLSLAYVLEGDPGVRGETGEEMTAALSGLDAHIAEIERTFVEEPAPADFSRFRDEYGAFLAVQDRMLMMTDEGLGQEALTLYGASDGDFQELLNVAHSLRHDAYEDAEAATSEAGSIISRAQYFLIGGLLAAALLIFAIGHPSSIYISNRVRALLEGTNRVSRGELDQPIGVASRDEFGALAEAFDGMVDSLRSAREDVGRLHGEALDMQEERIVLLQDQMARIVKAQEEERQRVARELHDQAGQTLTALQLGLSRIEAADPAPDVREDVASLRQLALEAMEIIRNLALDLRPSALDELGLPGALRDYIKTFARQTDIAADLEVSGAKQRLPPEAEVTIFRIVQEGLTNVAKHARASSVTVTLQFEAAKLRLVIEDDGVGFDTRRALGSERRRSLGLIGMRERCHLLGGEMHIGSRSHQGTRLAIDVPLETQDPVPREEELLGLR